MPKSRPAQAAMILAFVFAVILAVPFFDGLGWLLVRLFPFLKRAEAVVFLGSCLCIPLAFLKTTRPAVSTIWQGAFWLFIVGLWVLAFVAVFELWGVAGACFGVLLGGFGVIPVAALAALLKGDWPLLTALIIAAVAPIPPGIGMLYLMLKINADRYC